MDVIVGLEGKVSLLNILETPAATRYNPRMSVGRVVLSMSKGRISSTLISSTTRPGRSECAELNSTAKRSNC